MPRLCDTRTGVVVSVDDATASALGAAYEAVDKAPAKKAAPSKSKK